MGYVEKEFNNLPQSEKNLIMENAKLQAIVETLQKYRSLIEFEGKESTTATLFSDLLVSILEDYDKTKSHLLKDKMSQYVLCKNQ